MERGLQLRNVSQDDLKCGSILTETERCGALQALPIVKAISQQYDRFALTPGAQHPRALRQAGSKAAQRRRFVSDPIWALYIRMINTQESHYGVGKLSLWLINAFPLFERCPLFSKPSLQHKQQLQINSNLCSAAVSVTCHTSSSSNVLEPFVK